MRVMGALGWDGGEDVWGVGEDVGRARDWRLWR